MPIHAPHVFAPKLLPSNYLLALGCVNAATISILREWQRCEEIFQKKYSIIRSCLCRSANTDPTRIHATITFSTIYLHDWSCAGGYPSLTPLPFNQRMATIWKISFELGVIFYSLDTVHDHFPPPGSRRMVKLNSPTPL